MQSLVKGILDSVRPRFEKDGDLHRFFPFFEFPDTFFLTPDHETKKGAHVRDHADLKRLMMFVIFALVPATVFGMYNVGAQGFIAEGVDASLIDCFIRGAWHMLPIIAVSYAVGGLAEMVFCVVRQHEVNEGFLVTGLLFPLTLPPTIPLWMVAVGVVFGVVIGKEVFGGTGMNILNPALTARAFVFFSYPAAISGANIWDVGGQVVNPDTGEAFAKAWNPLVEAAPYVDGYTGATPLLSVASVDPAKAPAYLEGVARAEWPAAILAEHGWQWNDLFMGNIPGSMAEVSALAAILGAVFLIGTGIASWRIMFGCVTGVVGAAMVLNAVAGPDSVTMFYLPGHYHLVMGGFAFGAVFMATDPVSAAITPAGRLIYGFLIGAICVLVRVVNPAYPEGMMLAVLFMNVFAPLIDYTMIMNMRSRRATRMAAA